MYIYYSRIQNVFQNDRPPAIHVHGSIHVSCTICMYTCIGHLHYMCTTCVITSTNWTATTIQYPYVQYPHVQYIYIHVYTCIQYPHVHVMVCTVTKRRGKIDWSHINNRYHLSGMHMYMCTCAKNNYLYRVHMYIHDVQCMYMYIIVR